MAVRFLHGARPKARYSLFFSMKRHIVSVLFASLTLMLTVVAHAEAKEEDSVKVERFQSVAVMPPSDRKFAAVTPQGDGKSVAYERELKSTGDRVSIVAVEDRVTAVKARFKGIWRDAGLVDNDHWVVSSPDDRTVYTVDGAAWGKFFRERADKNK